MKNFRRALHEALRFWPTLLVATMCSLAVAVLWGGNILAFYPILEITLNGETVQSWVDREIETHEKNVTSLQTKVSTLQLEHDQQATQSKDLDRQLRKAKNDLLVEQGTLFSRQKMKPWVDRWVPPDPFRTVALIVAVLM